MFFVLNLMIFSVIVFSITFPEPITKYISDYTNIINPNIVESILKIGKELEEKTTAELTVVVVDTLQGLTVEDYANQLFRKWGIGKKDKNNGVLLLVAIRDRKMRIEVGYGLEGAIPDGKAGRIRDEYIIPYFKEGDYSKGVYYGYLALAQEIAKEYNAELSQGVGELPENQESNTTSISGIIFFVLVFSIVLIFGFYKYFKRFKNFVLYKLLRIPPSSPFERLGKEELNDEVRKVYVFTTSSKDLISGSAISVLDIDLNLDSDSSSSDSSFDGGDSGGGGASGEW